MQPNQPLFWLDRTPAEAAEFLAKTAVAARKVGGFVKAGAPGLYEQYVQPAVNKLTTSAMGQGIQGAWNTNPGLRNAVYGAGIGGLAGGAMGVFGKRRKNPLATALTGGLLGAGLGYGIPAAMNAAAGFNSDPPGLTGRVKSRAEAAQTRLDSGTAGEKLKTRLTGGTGEELLKADEAATAAKAQVAAGGATPPKMPTYGAIAAQGAQEAQPTLRRYAPAVVAGGGTYLGARAYQQGLNMRDATSGDFLRGAVGSSEPQVNALAARMAATRNLSQQAQMYRAAVRPNTLGPTTTSPASIWQATNKGFQGRPDVMPSRGFTGDVGNMLGRGRLLPMLGAVAAGSLTDKYITPHLPSMESIGDRVGNWGSGLMNRGAQP